MAKQALGKGLGALIGKVSKDTSKAAPVNTDPGPGDRVDKTRDKPRRR